MGEYSALLSLTALGGLVAGALVLFHVRVAPRRPRPQVPPPSVDALTALARFQIYAALFVAFGGLALLLAAWAARIDTLGRAGLGVAALVTAPVLVGFAHLIARGGLEDEAADGGGDGDGHGATVEDGAGAGNGAGVGSGAALEDRTR